MNDIDRRLSEIDAELNALGSMQNPAFVGPPMAPDALRDAAASFQGPPLPPQMLQQMETQGQQAALQQRQARRFLPRLDQAPYEAPPPGDTLRGLARGLPGVGSWTDEGIAATQATAQPVLDRIWPPPADQPPTTWGERYQTNVAAERERQQRFETEYPGTSTMLGLGGGLAGGLGVAGVAPKAVGLVAGSMPWRLGAGAAAGAGWGAAHGAGQGEGLEGRLTQAGRGAMIGAPIGAAVALPGAIANQSAERALAREFEVPRGAVRRVAADIAANQPAVQAAQLRAMTDPIRQGEATMLGELSGPLKERAALTAMRGGRGADRLAEAVEQRVAGASGRFAQAVDDELFAASSSLSHADRVALRRELAGGATPAAMAEARSVLGPKAADRLAAAAAEEARFASSAEGLRRASEEGVRMRAATRAGNPFGVGDVVDLVTHGGIPTASMLQRGATRLGGPAVQAMREGTETTRAGIADLLTRSGSERDAVIARLLEHNARSRAPDMSRDALRALLLGSAPIQQDNIWPPPSPASLMRRQAR